MKAQPEPAAAGLPIDLEAIVHALTRSTLLLTLARGSG